MTGCRLGGVQAASAETEGGGTLILRPAKKPGINEGGGYPLHASQGNPLDNRFVIRDQSVAFAVAVLARLTAGLADPSEIPDGANAVCADAQKDPSVSNETRIKSYLCVKQLAIA
jgi:hypothetical protein